MATKTRSRPRKPTRQHANKKPPPPSASRWLPVAAGLAVAALVGAAAFALTRDSTPSAQNAAAPAKSGLPDTPDYHSLAVDPADAARLFLGTHAGLFESRDGGRSWAHAGLSGQDAMNLVHAADGTFWVAGHEVLARSSDGGTTWADVRPEGLPTLDVHGFAADPTDAKTLYAAIAGAGLFRSTDGGDAFTLVSREVGPAVMALAVTPGGRILAGDMERGLLTSDDGGKTWKLALRASVMGIAVNPQRSQRILATGPGVHVSTDGGKTWDEADALVAETGPVAWADADTAYVVGLDGTLYKTTDAAGSWKAVSGG